MLFQSDSIFDCGTLARQYLAKAIDLLVETHKQSHQKKLFNLTDTFKATFLFNAAQLAIPNFEKAQQSFFDNMDISTKLQNEREETRQLFTLIHHKGRSSHNCCKKTSKRLHQTLKKPVLKQITKPCRDILFRLVTQKTHVHGLALHDVMS